MRNLAVLPALALAAVVALPAASQQASGALEIVATPTSSSSGPIAVGVDADVLCSGWIGGLDDVLPATIVGAQMVNSQTIYMEGDVVYLDIGSRRGAAAGQEYWVVRPSEVVWSSEAETAAVGRFYDTPARLRLICVQEDTAIAEISASCSDAMVGDQVLPFEPIPIPLVRSARRMTSCDPVTGKPVGKVVRIKDRATPAAQESIVYLDLGDRDGLAAGTFLTVYRTHAAIPSIRTVLGEVAVLATRETTSVAKVTFARDTVYVGDAVELK